MINDINADTEFNDALRAHGIIPPKPPTPPSPSTFLPTEQELFQHALSTASIPLLNEMEEDAINSDDERLFQSYRMKKLDELRQENEQARKVGAGDGLRPIARDDFVREVNEASQKDIPGEENEGKGTGVVCFLYKDSIPNSIHLKNILTILSPHHPTTHFLSIPGSQCIPNYPDKNIPTLLLYRLGDCIGQVVGLRSGLNTTPQDIERLLLARGVIERPSDRLAADLRRRAGRDEESEDDEEEDTDFGTLRVGKKGHARGLRQGGLGSSKGKGNGRGKGDSDDSDYDL